METMATMIDKKLSNFEVKIKKERKAFETKSEEKIKALPKQIQQPIAQLPQEEQFTATFKGGRRENAKVILEELHRLMLKHELTEIIYAARTKRL